MNKQIKDLTDDDILSNALRFSFERCPKDEKRAMDMEKIQKYKNTFIICLNWLRDNYKPACEDFLNKTETK